MQHSLKNLPLYLSAEEMKQLVKGVKKDRHRLGVALMAYGGLRVSEMCCLRVSDVNLARGFMRVNGKGGKQRYVPLTARLQELIEVYLSRHGANLSPESLLLGRTRASWHYVVKKYSSSVLGRKDIHCHTLRHSFATALYEDGVQLERISQLLGHARLDTTMIYSHISMKQKREAVMTLDGKRPFYYKYIHAMAKNKRTELQVVQYNDLIGRESELAEIGKHLSNLVSLILTGPKGVGKSAIMRKIDNSLYINEFKKKQTLVKIILHGKDLGEEIYKETEKQLKKLSIDELLEEIDRPPFVVVIDDITDLSKTDRKTVSELSRRALVVAASSRFSDRKLFSTYVEIKHLKRYHSRQILSGMIHMNDVHKKEIIVDDILHSSGDNLKSAEYIAKQIQMGKKAEEIVVDDQDGKEISIAPVLLIVVLFFFAWVLKSYATSMVALSYALLMVFRLVFMRYFFMPANRKRSV